MINVIHGSNCTQIVDLIKGVTVEITRVIMERDKFIDHDCVITDEKIQHEFDKIAT